MRTLSHLLAATCCVVFATNAQASGTWARSFSGLERGGYTNLHSIEVTPDGGYVVAGATANPADNGEWDYLVMKLDADGKIAWQKMFGSAGDDYARTAHPTADGGYIVSGSGPGLRVLKLDADGHVLWQKAYEKGVSALRPTPDGGYAFLGAIHEGPVLTYTTSLTKLDQDGTVNWSKHFDVVVGLTLIEASPEGSFVLAGSWGWGSPSRMVANVVKVDRDGSVLWHHRLSAEEDRRVASVKPTSDGGCIIAGAAYRDVNGSPDSDAWVVKLDARGMPTWQKALRGPGMEFAEAIHPTTDGGYVLVGGTGSKAHLPGGALMVKLDRNGNIVWQKVLSGLDPFSASVVRPTQDGGQVILGQVGRRAWIAKIDDGGNIEGCGNVTTERLVATDIESMVSGGSAAFSLPAIQTVLSSELPATVLPISVGELCYPSVPGTGMRAIEFVHLGHDHYFVTASPDEAQVLDSNAIPGWIRTRQMFDVFPLGTPGSSDVCRFWSGGTFAPKSSHFYAASETECTAAKENTDWQFEGEVFAVGTPILGTACGEGLTPLYRLYNDGKSGAPNHRYTASAYVASVMRSQGWIPEGSGVGIVGCVPQQ